MRERLNRAVSKTVEPSRAPRVRIPLSPDNYNLKLSRDSNQNIAVRILRRKPYKELFGAGRAGDVEAA